MLMLMLELELELEDLSYRSFVLYFLRNTKNLPSLFLPVACLLQSLFESKHDEQPGQRTGAADVHLPACLLIRPSIGSACIHSDGLIPLLLAQMHSCVNI